MNSKYKLFFFIEASRRCKNSCFFHTFTFSFSWNATHEKVESMRKRNKKQLRFQLEITDMIPVPITPLSSIGCKSTEEVIGGAM